MIVLRKVKRTDEKLVADMKIHYSQPKGFVGRNICYQVLWNDEYFGAIVGGSSTLHLVGRDEFFGFTASQKKEVLRHIVNNIFFHVAPQTKYPTRNFTTKAIRLFRKTVQQDWYEKYGDKVYGFETLVELPRTGECYKRDGWNLVGTTKGQTCKRIAGKGTDSWTGKRVWDTKNLRPKYVFVRWADGFPLPPEQPKIHTCYNGCEEHP